MYTNPTELRNQMGRARWAPTFLLARESVAAGAAAARVLIIARITASDTFAAFDILKAGTLVSNSAQLNSGSV